MKAEKLSTLKAKLWRLTSEYVRRSYANKEGYVSCYTCGFTYYWNEVDAGHGIGGRSNAVLFDLEIIRPQCKKCNMPPNCGMYYEFGKRLNQENGEGWYEEKKIKSTQPVKFTKSAIKDMIEEMKQKIAGLGG